MLNKKNLNLQKLLLYSRAHKLYAWKIWDYTCSKILKITLIGSDKRKITFNNTAAFLNNDREGRVMKQRLEWSQVFIEIMGYAEWDIAISRYIKI